MIEHDDEGFRRAIEQFRRERNAEDALPMELPENGQLAMRRHDFIELLLAEFESYLSPRVDKPYRIALADDGLWSDSDRVAHCPPNYPHRATGVYLFVDQCPPDEPHTTSSEPEGRYSVIRYIGSATNHFYDEVRKANWEQPGGLKRRFLHRWIDIICVPRDFGFLTLALEDFLISRVRTTHNRRRAPKAFSKLRPLVFDEAAPPQSFFASVVATNEAAGEVSGP